MSSEIELEPKAISLPELDNNEPSPEDDMATSLVPQFDSLTSEGTLSDEDSITLLVPTDSSVILPENSTPVLSIDAEPISNPLNSPISETPTIPEQGTTGKDILAEPNLIQDNADTFIALASHQSDRLPPPEREKTKSKPARKKYYSVTLTAIFCNAEPIFRLSGVSTVSQLRHSKFTLRKQDRPGRPSTVLPDRRCRLLKVPYAEC